MRQHPPSLRDYLADIVRNVIYGIDQLSRMIIHASTSTSAVTAILAQSHMCFKKRKSWDFDRGIREAVARGMTQDDIIKYVTFEHYRDARNHCRTNLFIDSYIHFLPTGMPENAFL